MSKKKLSYHWFTLIELLIVVAIIIILLSLIQPSLRRAFEQARLTLCTANLKNHALAMDLYTEDYRKFPTYNEWARGSWGGGVTHEATLDVVRTGALWEYAKNTDFYKCPTFSEVIDGMSINNNFSPDKPYVLRDWELDFAYNYTMNGQDTDGVRFQGNAPNVVNNPSRLAYIAEENPYIFLEYAKYQLNNAEIIAAPDFSRDGLASFHLAETDGDLNFSGLSNVLYMDGHASLEGIEDTYEVLSDR